MNKRRKQTNYADIDIHDLLKHRRQIAMIWDTEDVRGLRPDLSEEQAWEVLQLCDNRADCELGLTWTLIESMADELFPAPDDGDW